MDSREEIGEVLKLDAVSATLKLMAIVFIPITLVNAAKQTSMWYLIVFLDAICIAIYKCRTSSILF